MRSGQQAALGADLLGFLDGLGVDQAILGGYDWGGRAACIVSVLWPGRVRGLVSVNGYNIQAIAQAGEPHSPEAEHRSWYQYYGVTPPHEPPPRFTALRGHQRVPRAGHDLPQEAPEAFAAAVLALL
jgi:pimeloyl-ACP methyl ester carboxylesterase